MSNIDAEPLIGMSEADCQQMQSAADVDAACQSSGGGAGPEALCSTTANTLVNESMDCHPRATRGLNGSADTGQSAQTGVHDTGCPPENLDGQAEPAAAAEDSLTPKELLEMAFSMFPGGRGPPVALTDRLCAGSSTNGLLLDAVAARDALFQHYEIQKGESLPGPVDREEALGFLLAGALQPGILGAEDARAAGAKARKQAKKLPVHSARGSSGNGGKGSPAREAGPDASRRRGALRAVADALRPQPPAATAPAKARAYRASGGWAP